MRPFRLSLSVTLLSLVCCHHVPKTSAPRAPRLAGQADSAIASAQPVAAGPVRRDLDDDPIEEVAPDVEVDEAAKDVLAAKDDRAPVPRKSWDRKVKPKYLARIEEHLGLTGDEKRLLDQNGFVVLSRVTASNYGTMLHAIHQQELPLYVSADAIMQGVFKFHESLLMSSELRAQEEISEVLTAMEAALAKSSGAYTKEVARDAHVYLGVARALLGNDDKDPEIRALADKATEAKGIEQVTLFGRPRMVDWTFYEPRGPYVRGLQEYFRAMVWLTRLELNLASRGAQSSAPVRDASETPREATLALVLADVAQKAKVEGKIAALDRFYRLLSGPREDVSLADLAKLGAGLPLGDPDAASAGLRNKIGQRFTRTVNYHYRPYEAPELPVIATLFGVGIVPDAAAITALARKSRPRVVRGQDVAYALGVDRAQVYVEPDAQALLPASRATLRSARTGPDLYAAWLSAVQALAVTPKGTLPAFMETTAFADARVSSMLTAYGQIRHAYALHGVQVYDEGGCQIPDAYVEPALPVYDAILAYAARMREAKAIWPEVEGPVEDLTRHIGALRAIVVDELAGKPLSEPQIRYLRMVAEYERPSGYTAHRPGKFNGWYPRLFGGVMAAFEPATFIADYFTSTIHGKVSYLGALEPRVGIFVVDVGGEPRAMVGPVTHASERVEPLAKRLADEDIWKLERSTAPWERSYVAPSAVTPDLDVGGSFESANVHARGTMGEITVEAVDEHGETLSRGKVKPKREESVEVVLLPVPGRSGEVRTMRFRTASGAVWDGSGYGGLLGR